MNSDLEEEFIVDPKSVDAGYEVHDVSIPAIALFTIFCLTTIIASVFALDGYFVYSRERLLRSANIYAYTDLIELRANEHQKLSNYAIIDKNKGIYSIPIDRAMELLANEAFTEKKTD